MMKKYDKGLVIEFLRDDARRNIRWPFTPSDSLTRAILVGEDVPELIHVSKTRPAYTFDATGLVLVPAERPYWMENAGAFWGPEDSLNFAWSPDPRFPRPWPVPVHDRYTLKI